MTAPNVQPEPITSSADNGRLMFSCWPRLLSVELAALYLGLSPKTIRNHQHKLPGMRKWGGKIVFDRKANDTRREGGTDG